MSGEDELREAIARRLCTSWAGWPGHWDDASEDDERAAFYSDADAVLALPEVAALRAKAAAADRVRELADTYAFLGATLHDVPRAETWAEAATELRAALDGPPC